MKKKFQISGLLLCVLAIGTFAYNFTHTKVQASEKELNQAEKLDDESEDFDWLEKVDNESDYGEKSPALSQEQYDSLMDSIPEGATLYTETEVLPGVIRNKEKDPQAE